MVDPGIGDQKSPLLGAAEPSDEQQTVITDEVVLAEGREGAPGLRGRSGRTGHKVPDGGHRVATVGVGIPSPDSEPTALTFTLFCAVVAALGPLAFGYTLGYTSPALLGMQADLQLSTTEASFFSAIVNVGAMIGAVSGGSLADRLGRKKALAVAAVPFVIGWASIAFSSEIIVLCIGRLLCGFGTGVVSFAVPVYIAEIAPGHLRGGLGALNQLAITMGILLVYTFGLLFQWRTLAVIGVIPPVLLLIGLVVIPESPRWLAQRDSSDTLAVTLRKLRGIRADISAEMQEIQAAMAESHAQPQASLRDLLEPNLRRPLQVAVGLMVLQQFSGVNAVMFFAGSIFQAVGFRDPNVPGFLIQAVQVAMTAVAAGLMDKAGRRVLLMVSASGLAAGSFLLGLSFSLQGLDSQSSLGSIASPLALLALLLYIVAFSLGMGAIPWIIMSEIFPAHVRGIAGSLSVLTNWMACFVVTLTFGYLLRWSSTGAFCLYGAECLGTILFVAFLVPETRGRSLEEIEASFKAH